jgi:hypothetical protein
MFLCEMTSVGHGIPTGVQNILKEKNTGAPETPPPATDARDPAPAKQKELVQPRSHDEIKKGWDMLRESKPFIIQMASAATTGNVLTDKLTDKLVASAATTDHVLTDKLASAATTGNVLT